MPSQSAADWFGGGDYVGVAYSIIAYLGPIGGGDYVGLVYSIIVYLGPMGGASL